MLSDDQFPGDGPPFVGVDLIEIERIKKALRRWGDRFIARVYTPEEATASGGEPAALAMRFAAKEAASKALGTGIGPVSWREIEVRVGTRGRPLLALHGAAREVAVQLGVTRSAVSLTDTKDQALAVVILS
ncbi:MAG: holo-ACP synthase [Anaerolineae bacterium]|nr:holo-ACP synthase [Anaerolineae bacterium]